MEYICLDWWCYKRQGEKWRVYVEEKMLNWIDLLDTKIESDVEKPFCGDHFLIAIKHNHQNKINVMQGVWKQTLNEIFVFSNKICDQDWHYNHLGCTIYVIHKFQKTNNIFSDYLSLYGYHVSNQHI